MKCLDTSLNNQKIVQIQKSFSNQENSNKFVIGLSNFLAN